MKALEILKSLQHNNDIFDFTIDEAIAELEALQTPKTCDGCKWDADVWHDGCDGCMRKYVADYYEPKANQ